MNYNKQLHYTDMATEKNCARTFSGEENKDIIAWIRDMKALAWAINFDESALMKYIVSNLRGKALSWAAEKIDQDKEIGLQRLLNLLVERFSPEGIEDRILNRFLGIKLVENRMEFKSMIEDATRIREGSMLNLKSLIKQFIVRCLPK